MDDAPKTLKNTFPPSISPITPPSLGTFMLSRSIIDHPSTCTKHAPLMTNPAVHIGRSANPIIFPSTAVKPYAISATARR